MCMSNFLLGNVLLRGKRKKKLIAGEYGQWTDWVIDILINDIFVRSLKNNANRLGK